MKILIVDDDDALLSFLTKELEAREFEVLPTHFGEWGTSSVTEARAMGVRAQRLSLCARPED
jgi:DNA-binding response OmpR family regulator